jgi:ferrous iron transport protein B
MKRTALPLVAIVGSPNVGKSALFNALTGAHIIVSNYPGTTVEVSRGRMHLGDAEVEVVDTPGMYSLSPVTDEERVARQMLMTDHPDVVLQVIDAKNLRRMLTFTLQLLEAELPLILVLNIMDEAARLGMKIDCGQLSQALGIPVVPTISLTGEGVDDLRVEIAGKLSAATEPSASDTSLPHPPPSNLPLTTTARTISNLLDTDYGLSHYTIAALLLNEDEDILAVVHDQETEKFPLISRELAAAQKSQAQPAGYFFWQERQRLADKIVDRVSTAPIHRPVETAQVLSRLMMRPLTGIPILIAILYVGIYLFVGRLGGGVLVDLLQNKLFGNYINPAVTHMVEHIIPWPVVQDLFVHDYGVITLGLKYAVAIILPIVATFFLAFSVIEDTGYLPRLALLIDRFFKTIGLSGRAVIPMVLGFGCGTMATLVTRVLETRRERVLATLLLALAIPCSAQLGVILGMLSHVPWGLEIWGAVVGLVALLVGFISSRLLKGEAASFYIEVPPLRWPKLGSILTKTLARMQWYFIEIAPLFALASLVIWLGRQVMIFGHSAFDWTISAATPFVTALGLPKQTAVAFVFGFFRRDYGAAGLYDLHERGLLGGAALVVAMVTMTLFLPCMAQWLIMQKERGLRTTLAITGFIFPFAWLVGFGLHLLFQSLRVTL